MLKRGQLAGGAVYSPLVTNHRPNVTTAHCPLSYKLQSAVRGQLSLSAVCFPQLSAFSCPLTVVRRSLTVFAVRYPLSASVFFQLIFAANIVLLTFYIISQFFDNHYFSRDAFFPVLLDIVRYIAFNFSLMRQKQLFMPLSSAVKLATSLDGIRESAFDLTIDNSFEIISLSARSYSGGGGRGRMQVGV